MEKENIDESKMIALLNFIKYQENNKKNVKSRRVNENDLFGKSLNKKVINENKNNGEKIASFRMQEEFGPKKRIKP